MPFPYNSSTSYHNPAFVVPPPPFPQTPINRPHFSNQLPSIKPYPIQNFNPQSIQFPPEQQQQQQQPLPNPLQFQNFSYSSVPTYTSAPHAYTVPLTISNPFSRTLPTVSHIPILTNKSDFFAWDEGVTSLLHANGLIGHILDPSEPLDPL